MTFAFHKKSYTISTVFWPDLASCHYGKDALEWYAINNVTAVSKSMNPPNSPELRPIETYWALVKQTLKKTENDAKNESDFKNMWRLAANKIRDSTVQDMMSSIKRKIRDFGRSALV